MIGGLTVRRNLATESLLGYYLDCTYTVIAVMRSLVVQFGPGDPGVEEDAAMAMTTDHRSPQSSRWVPDGVRHDQTWDERIRKHREAQVPRQYPTWQPPAKGAPPVVQVQPAANTTFDPVRPGLMRLYAARMAHAGSVPRPEREARDGERLLVGELVDEAGAIRTMALVGEVQPFGRGLSIHEDHRHPALQMRYRRLRCGSFPVPRRFTIPEATWPVNHPVSRSFWSTLLQGWKVNAFHPRLGVSTRFLLASFAALILLLGAASTSMAQQYRYEVQPGDTIESIATEFGVDPEAIRTASWLPTGDALEAGQVLIIPEPGQSPVDAAQMAAANSGTSPWALGAHQVGWGENPASIASLYGVSVDDLMEINGIEDPLDLVAGTVIVIPASGPGSITGPGADAVIAADVPLYKQRRNLSCEYAASYAAAMAFGWAPSEDVFIESVPLALNPHNGYRGNIDGWWGNTDDYGVYAEPLVPVLEAWGFNAEVMYTMGDTAPLIAQLDAGRPVVTWLGFWGDTRTRLTDDGDYSVFAGMHVVTVFGYDAEGVWAMDPARGEQVHYTWDFFVSMWTVVDGMSLAVSPQ